MRITKDAAERRGEILDAAEELFYQKGFDKASTNDILEKVGIARGTLYYHFKSKEDIMDGLINRYGDQLISAVSKISSDQSIPLIDRILQTLLSMNITESGGQKMIEQIHRPQNALMHQKMREKTFNTIPSILAGLIQEGINEGMFHTPYPKECMEMLVIYASTLFDDDIIPLTAEEKKIRIDSFIFNMERLLGAEENSLQHMKSIFEA